MSNIPEASLDIAPPMDAEEPIETLYSTAREYEQLGRFDDARTMYARIGQARPFDFDAALQELRCSINVCDWQRYVHLQRIVHAAVRYGSGWVCGETVLASPAFSPVDLLACATRNAAAVRERARKSVPVDDGEIKPGQARTAIDAQATTAGRRLRVGFLGRDFYQQATSYLMVGLIEEHDRASVEYFAYDYGPVPRDPNDPLRNRIHPAFDVFNRVEGWSNAQIAGLIADQQIEVLVFLQSPTDERCGVLTLRPARVQLAFLYYPGGFGCSLVDAIVADEVVIPRALEHLYTEKIARLPRCYQPNDAHRPIPARVSREMFGLPADAFILANFGQPYKLTPSMFDLWCELMRDHPQTVLWLMAPDAVVVRNLRHEAAVRGVAPSRLFFGPVEPTERHLCRLGCADLILDTFPYGGHTGTSDALWAGVPVVTLAGERFASRVAASLLEAAGLAPLVAGSERDYVRIAAQLIERNRWFPHTEWRIVRNQWASVAPSRRSRSTGDVCVRVVSMRVGQRADVNPVRQSDCAFSRCCWA